MKRRSGRSPGLAMPVIAGLLASALAGCARHAVVDVAASEMAAMQAHPHDPGKMAEHGALLELLPRTELASHVARADGPWSSAETWAEGTVPERGAIVYIPAPIRVTYEGDSPEHYFLVRVDGTLRIQAPDGQHTRMIVDTLFSTPESMLEIEADDPTDGSIEIEFRPFDIEAYEREGSPAWGPDATAFYSDGATVTDTGKPL